MRARIDAMERSAPCAGTDSCLEPEMRAGAVETQCFYLTVDVCLISPDPNGCGEAVTGHIQSLSRTVAMNVDDDRIAALPEIGGFTQMRLDAARKRAGDVRSQNASCDDLSSLPDVMSEEVACEMLIVGQQWMFFQSLERLVSRIEAQR